MSNSLLLKAVDDLQVRTLDVLGTDLAKVVYLASTRDYNTGSYSHQGLEFRFTKPIAEMALETCHEQIFEKISRCRLEELVQELANYLQCTNEEPETVIQSWSTLAPYHLLTPRNCRGVAKEYFISNVKFALEILQADPSLYRRSPGAASPQR